MKRTTEIELANELLLLSKNNTPFLDSEESTNPVTSYLSDERFYREMEMIFRKTPQPIAHSSELPTAGSFIRRDLAGLPLLITRDKSNHAHVFINVCRHRGTRLVDDQNGCKKRFSCPYHGWTWSNDGELVSIPGKEHGFPNIDRNELGLKRLGVIEQFGWIWVHPESDTTPNLTEYLDGLETDLSWIEADQHVLVHSDEMLWEANWKLLSEGGLEAYHFKVAHPNTIGPYFKNNLSSYQEFNGNFRSILAKESIAELENTPQSQWRLRDHAQIAYGMFPSSAFLVQSDHVAWIQFNPIEVGITQTRVSSLVPKDRYESEKDRAHWQKNHLLTVETLSEDFKIGESIQLGLASNANESVTFGRFEGALAKLNQHIDRMID